MSARALGVALVVGGVLVAAVGVVGQLSSGGRDDGASAARSAPTTPRGTVTTTTTTSAPPSVEAFVADLVTAIRAGDNEFKFDRLHPAVVDRYGDAACRAGLSGAQPAFDLRVLSVGAREAWAWETDGLTTTIAGTMPVTVERTAADGVTTQAVIHLAEAGGEIRWFTDCGTPQAS